MKLQLVEMDKDLVQEKLKGLVQDKDLSRFIL